MGTLGIGFQPLCKNNNQLLFLIIFNKKTSLNFYSLYYNTYNTVSQLSIKTNNNLKVSSFIGRSQVIVEEKVGSKLWAQHIRAQCLFTMQQLLWRNSVSSGVLPRIYGRILHQHPQQPFRYAYWDGVFEIENCSQLHLRISWKTSWKFEHYPNS